MKNNSMQRQAGVTLIELIVTLFVVAIVTMVAIPAFRTFLQNNRMIAVTNDVVLAFNAARSEAVKRRQTVRVCAGDTASGCQAGAGFDEGWLVWIDGNGNDQFDAGEELLVQNKIEGLTIEGFDAIRFDASGVPDSSGTLSICDSRGVDSARGVSVLPTGRITTSGVTPSCG